MLSPIAFLLLHQPGSLGTTALLLIRLQTEPVRQKNEAKTRPASVRTVQPAAQASGTSPQSSAGCSRPCATPSDSEGFRQHRNVNWKGEAMNQNLDEQSTVASLGSSRAGLNVESHGISLGEGAQNTMSLVRIVFARSPAFHEFKYCTYVVSFPFLPFPLDVVLKGGKTPTCFSRVFLVTKQHKRWGSLFTFFSPFHLMPCKFWKRFLSVLKIPC